MIVEMLLYGFISAFGWWGANHYIIEPYFPPQMQAPKKTKEE